MDTSSKFYRTNQRCVYHSNNVGHDTEDYINLKHKNQDLIDQEVVSLQEATPNFNTKHLPNHADVNINMIETNDDWCVSKLIAPVVHDELQKVRGLIKRQGEKEFVILTPAKDVTFVQPETLVRQKLCD